MNKKIKTALLVMAALLCFSVLLGACGEKTPEETQSKEATYKVSVVDILGNPYTDGVVVRFLQNGEPVAMQVVDANGVVEKVLTKGDYTVDLAFTGNEGDYHYDQTGLTLTAEKTELEVPLAYAITGEPTALYAQGVETTARTVKSGCTYTTLTAGERNYFLFSPAIAGTYEISVSGAVEQLGYYGSPFFVCEDTIAEVVNNGFTVSIRADMIGTDGGTTTLVIGIDPGTAGECILSIERTGDPEYTMEDEPWTVYTPTADLKPYTLPANAVIHEFDLTASTDTYQLVYSEEDGYFHLDSADGPLVLVRLASENKYMDCYQKVLENAGVRKYFFDDNGEFVKKEEYSDCLLTYLEYVDEDSGVYPLTEDLKYIIQQHGDASGWYDEEGMCYLFLDMNGNKVSGINADISWLFMCCYITEN